MTGFLRDKTNFNRSIHMFEAKYECGNSSTHSENDIGRMTQLEGHLMSYFQRTESRFTEDPKSFLKSLGVIAKTQQEIDEYTDKIETLVAFYAELVEAITMKWVEIKKR
jgi:hypothetical protein